MIHHKKGNDMTYWKRTKKIAATALFAGAAFLQQAMAGEITVYSALEEEEINLFVEKAKEELPDVKINVLRLSTGNLTARLIAEAGNPQADVVLSLPVTNIMNPTIEAMFEPYAVKGVDKVPAQFRDPENRWFSLAGYVEVFCANTDRLATLGLPVPKSWEELADPKYKGEVVMPDPVSSGVGFVNITALIYGLGEEKGWDLIGRLTKNIAQFTSSGSRPCRMAQAGEFAIGVSYEVPAIQAVNEGYPVETVLPGDWVGFEISGIGLLKGAKNPDDGKKFLDWMLTPSPLGIYASLKPVTTIPGTAQSEAAKEAGFPADISSRLSKMDFAAMARDREQILARWSETTGR
ncbi:hypothetical protein ShzoTeo12_42790 (plasmid) [Shinella zoogloeoides]|nr:hypothetical protein ShzoTeo12_42790 [Shinella zoogloeoides]